MSVEQGLTHGDRPEPPYPLHHSVVNRIDSQYATFYNKHIYNNQQVHLQPIEASRASGTLIPGAGPLAPVAQVEDYFISREETTGPRVRVRAFTPHGERPEGGWPVCVYFHGGGWVLGTIDTENVIATNLCARSKCVVVAVDYRLAPEDPFPAAVDDSWESVLWVLGEGKKVLHLDTTKLATGGSSAGGNLAAIMCQRAAALGSPNFSLQLLSVPVTDNTADTTNSVSWKENQHTPALPAPKMMWYRNHYLPNQSDWSHPEASPLLWEGDWSKLPRAVIVVGELDVLRDEGQQFGEKLRNAGVAADVHLMKGQPHPFIAMDGVLDAGRDAITYFCDALREAMYPTLDPVSK
ncbi:alpha/beta hydrolase fold-domain-containing protein [Annulohypoxylon truncatum]|uniref:alpha/beta hydrolase fold-domain-containing protein n=1 Tax=Annulohypoxylon truncatum TaxID=327061 RepID=UPI00200865EE|nr:alpha/beta hydrolase fold-domain-containing protein [Annulohypoxylon truncatum]KAI1209795.1 alpha/beta hydrolase fold-domain-containing protein [Annulohypoxylon truncatum]